MDQTGTAPSRTRFSINELRIVAAVSCVIIAIGFAFYAPTQADSEMIDHALFTNAVDEMRSGSGYYQSMEDAFAVVYGPERAELTESVRGFRPPTTFLIWRMLPNERAMWLLFVAVAAVCGILASRLAAQPIAGVVVTAYLLAVGMLNVNGTWTAQFAATELWAIPFMLGAVLSIRRDRWWLAAGLGLAAVAVRETSATLLLAGLGLALLGKVPWKPWVASASAAVALYAVHATLAGPFIEPGLAAALPSRAEIPGSLLRIVGFGLPAGPVIGLILWLLAVWYVANTQKHPLLLLSYLSLPLIGLVLERHYWGILVVPFTLIWGIDVLSLLMKRVTQRDDHAAEPSKPLTA